jgi:tungstate transport system substrate-binding protein
MIRWVGWSIAAAALIIAGLIAMRYRSDRFAEFPAVVLPAASSQPAADFSLPTTRPQPATSGPAVRVAVIGGMVQTGFWDELAFRFESETHIPVKLVSAGDKDTISTMFKKGGIDLITMHASDAIINLVADGYARDPLPWARNDMIIVGPASDPAGIKGMSDAGEALRKIAEKNAKFVVHSSLGAQDVMLSIMDPLGITFDPAVTTILFDDKQRRVLQVAAEQRAYTMLGRIPFETGRIPNSGLVVMVRGDLRLRRPFVVAVADPSRVAGVHVEQAEALERFMCGSETQEWIGEFGRGKWDEESMFFPVVPSR